MLVAGWALDMPGPSRIVNNRYNPVSIDLIGLIFSKATSTGNQEIVKIH